MSEELDARSYGVLLVFILVNICVIRPVRFKLLKTSWSCTLDYCTATLLGLLILLSTTCIGSEQLVRGIVGNETSCPYAIIILFFSLAYICVSLDETGLFRYLAFSVAQTSSGSRRRLFAAFYLLNAFLTIFTSNDVVVSSSTIFMFICNDCVRL